MADHFMPDETLREIAQLQFPEGDPERPASCHFDAYSERELQIANLQEFISVPSMRQILEWSGCAEPRTGDGTPPPLSKQLAVSLRVLDCRGDADEAYGAGAHAAAHRTLTRILMAHPVLLHPYLRVGVGLSGSRLTDDRSTCSLAHAIALAPHGRFPMERDGLTRSELAQFVNHPCVRMGLTFRQPSHRRVVQRAEKMTPLRAGLGQSFDRAALVASLHGLHQVMEASPSGAPRGGANLLLESLEDDTMIEVPHVYARAFLDAVGLRAVPPSRDGQVGARACPEFVHLVADADSYLRERLKPALRSIAHPAIFYRGGATPPGHVHAGVRLLVDGLVAAGLFEDATQGACWARADLTGGLPAAGVAQAMAYLRALDELGLHDCEAFFESEEMGRARSKPQGVPWETAVRAYATEMRMQRSIRQAGGHTGASEPEPGQRAAGAVPPAGGRRLRAHI